MTDERDRDGRTALHYASMITQGTVDEAKALISAGAEINAVDNMGWTPLHFAARGNPEVVKLLINAGANLEARDVNGNTPVVETTLTPGDEARVAARILLSAGADPDTKNKYDRSARDVVNDIVNQEPTEVTVGRDNGNHGRKG